jgi:hypothetical protein
MPEMEQQDERELRGRFAELRAKEAGVAPPFSRVVAGRPARRGGRWLVPAMALGAVAIFAVALATWRRAPADDVPPEFALVPGSMRVPTDYFLDLATTMRADEIPTIGSVDWYPLVSESARVKDSRRRN